MFKLLCLERNCTENLRMYQKVNKKILEHCKMEGLQLGFLEV